MIETESPSILICIECMARVCSLVAVPYTMEAPDKVSFGVSYIMRDESWVWVGLGGAAGTEPRATPDRGGWSHEWIKLSEPPWPVSTMFGGGG